MYHNEGIRVQRVQRGRFLRWTGLMAGGFLSLTAFQAEGCGGGFAANFIMPPAAVTSTSSIIIILTTVHPFATSWPSSPKGDARTLRDWLYGSYGMIRMPVIGSLRSPPKGETAEWYMKYMTLCFSPQIPRFPLRGTPRRGKGCTGQSTDLTPHRGPDRQSAACVIFASYHWTRLRCEGSKGSEGKVLKIDRPYRPEGS